MLESPDWIVYAKIILWVVGILWIIAGALIIFNQLIIQRFKLFLAQRQSPSEIPTLDFLQLLRGLLMLLCGIAIDREYPNLLLILLFLLVANQGGALFLQRRQRVDLADGEAGHIPATESGFFKFSLLITLLAILLYLQGAL